MNKTLRTCNARRAFCGKKNLLSHTFILLLSLIFSLTLFSADETVVKVRRQPIPIIESIGFLLGRPGEHVQLKPPEDLILTVRITQAARYKLTLHSITIGSGTFKPGDNALSFPAFPFLEKSAVHELILETSGNGYQFRYLISLTIRLQAVAVQTMPGTTEPAKSFSIEATPPVNYEIEMYIQGHKAARNRKIISIGLPQKTRERLARAIDPDLLNPRHPDSKHFGQIKNKENSMTMSGLPFALFQLIKGKSKPPPPPIPRNMTMFFRQKDEQNIARKINAQFSLIYQNIK